MKTFILRKTFTLILSLFCVASFSFKGNRHFIHNATPIESDSTAPAILYTGLNPENPGVPKEAFDYAVKGLIHLKSACKIQNDSIISIVDFTQTSDKKRLYIINLNNGKIIFNTYVAHGRNSGLLSANEFSNKPDSYKSSLGFYITGNTYEGRHGYSLKLEGAEDGINDNIEKRSIVMHAADYADESFIKARGYLGLSEGCLAIPENMHKAIISKIKNGSCIFVYSRDNYYLNHSQVLNKN